MSSTHMDEISAVFRRAVAEAERRGYERGRVEAKREMLALLTTDSPTDQHETPVTTPQRIEAETGRYAVVTHDPTITKERTRAPRGTVPALIRRVLGAEPGLTPKEIGERATSAAERSIAAASIRSELNTGKDRGRYDTRDGKWFLSGEAEGQTAEAQPSASDSDKEDDDAAALI